MIQELTLLQGLQIAIYGFLTVFIMLSLLMVIVMIMSKVVEAAQNKKPVEAKEEEAPLFPTTQHTADTMFEYCGEIQLVDVDTKTAACIMAIISDQTQIPLENLIFKKITLLEEE